MPKRKDIIHGSTPSKAPRQTSCSEALAHSQHQHPGSHGPSSAPSRPPSVAAFMQRMDSFSTSALVRDVNGSVRMVSKDKGLNVVAQLTGMGINEQLCCLHLPIHILPFDSDAVRRAQQAMLKGCNTGYAPQCLQIFWFDFNFCFLAVTCCYSGRGYGMDRRGRATPKPCCADCNIIIFFCGISSRGWATCHRRFYEQMAAPELESRQLRC